MADSHILQGCSHKETTDGCGSLCLKQANGENSSALLSFASNATHHVLVAKMYSHLMMTLTDTDTLLIQALHTVFKGYSCCMPLLLQPHGRYQACCLRETSPVWPINTLLPTTKCTRSEWSCQPARHRPRWASWTTTFSGRASGQQIPIGLLVWNIISSAQCCSASGTRGLHKHRHILAWRDMHCVATTDPEVASGRNNDGRAMDKPNHVSHSLFHSIYSKVHFRNIVTSFGYS